MSLGEITAQAAIPVDDVDPRRIKLSSLQKKTWTKDGQEMSTSFLNVSYVANNGQEVPLVFELRANDTEFMSTSGIRMAKYGNHFCTVNLPDRISQLAKKTIDDRIVQLIFENRNDIFPAQKVSKMVSPDSVALLYEGVISPGAPKKDDPSKNYMDSIFCDPPMKKEKEHWTVNTDLLTIVDKNDNPLTWTALEGSRLVEVAVEIIKISMHKGYPKVKCRARVMVTKSDAVTPVTTRRRLELGKRKLEEPVPALEDAPSTTPADGEESPEKRQKMIEGPPPDAAADGSGDPSTQQNGSDEATTNGEAVVAAEGS